jgi:hypothetical protein
MLGNKIPGLEYTIGHSGAGICVNTQDEQSIHDGLKELFKDLDEFSRRSKEFFNSVDFVASVNQLIR